MSQFQCHILNYAKTHPDDPLSAYFIQNFESLARRKAEHRKWKMIADALVVIDAAKVLNQTTFMEGVDTPDEERI